MICFFILAFLCSIYGILHFRKSVASMLIVIMIYFIFLNGLNIIATTRVRVVRFINPISEEVEQEFVGVKSFYKANDGKSYVIIDKTGKHIINPPVVIYYTDTYEENFKLYLEYWQPSKNSGEVTELAKEPDWNSGKA